MSTSEALAMTCTGEDARERVHYFSGQLMTAADMKAEQDYFRQKLRRHNRYLHGWGVVCGCEVKPSQDKDHPWQVRVCPGYVITPQGDEIWIPEAVDFDFASELRKAQDPCARPVPCPPTGRTVAGDQSGRIYLAVCYAECDSRPVRVHPVGCACDEAACEYSRIRDSFELKQMLVLPESHSQAEKEDARWKNELKDWAASRLSLPPCPDTYDDNCVVLAGFIPPADRNKPIAIEDLGFEHRRVLYSAATLHAMIESRLP